VHAQLRHLDLHLAERLPVERITANCSEVQ